MQGYILSEYAATLAKLHIVLFPVKGANTFTKFISKNNNRISKVLKFENTSAVRPFATILMVNSSKSISVSGAFPYEQAGFKRSIRR